jgi:putative flippase GtrA
VLTVMDHNLEISSPQYKPGSKSSTLFQFIKYTLMSLVTTLVDMGGFALLNYWVFTGFRQVAFRWWLFDYRVENGGLSAFLALVISFAISQTVNFFIQRKVTFGANNNKLYSAIIYAVMVVSVYFFTLWLPTLFIEWLYVAIGENWGGIITKMVCMTVSFLIQFPMNKWVIMRKDAKPKG